MTKAWLPEARSLRAGVLVLVVVITIAAVQVVRVHQSTGEFRLTPSEAPPKLRELGRDYQRSDGSGRAALPRDAREIGETSGGGEVFGPRHVSMEGTESGPTAVTVLWVRDDSGRVWTYALMGGP